MFDLETALIKFAQEEDLFPKHILVTGHSGAGKSTLAKQLSKERGLPLIELDKMMRTHPQTKAMFDKTDPNRPSAVGKTFAEVLGRDVLDSATRDMVLEALAAKNPSVIEGSQVMSHPDLVKGQELHLVDPTIEEIIRRRTNRRLERGKAVRPFEAEIAQKLIDEYGPGLEKLRKYEGVVKHSSLENIIEALRKEADFAPGIPASRERKPLPRHKAPQNWDYVLHEHDAARAGKHYDLRLSDGENAHSWAVRKGLPEPGRKHLAVFQPTHRPEYMKFKGEIEEGYGKGRVDIADKGPVRILESKPDKVRFVLTGKRDPEEFVLFRPKGKKQKPHDWLLYNITPTRETRKDVPNAKPKYKNAHPEDLHQYLDSRFLLGAKIDGAHVITEFRKRNHPEATRTPQVFSYRPSQRSNRLINHTHRIPGMDEFNYPRELEDTIVRGEIYGVDKKTGRAIPSNKLGGVLNSTTSRSLQLQKDQDIELRKAMFDVVKYKGKNVEDKPYKEKLRILKEIDKLTPDIFGIPDYAISPKAKLKLFNKIKQGKNPLTSEGVVAWNMETGSPPVKLKIRPDYDVYVRKIFPGKGKYENTHAGGFEYSLTPRGDIVGRVGTGFTDEMRRKMWKDKKSYKGRVAKVTSLEQFPSGALRAPAFSGQWHLEKGKQR